MKKEINEKASYIKVNIVSIEITSINDYVGYCNVF